MYIVVKYYKVLELRQTGKLLTVYFFLFGGIVRRFVCFEFSFK